MPLTVRGARALLGLRVPPVPLPGLGATEPEEGRGGLGRYVRSQEARPGRHKEERFPHGNLGLGERRTSFVSGSTCGGGILRRVARGAREVLSSSAAEAAAAATRMDFLSHPNSTVQHCSPQSGGIPPASDAAVAAAPRARLGETNSLLGGRPEGKRPLKGQGLTPSPQRYYTKLLRRKKDQNECFASRKGARHPPSGADGSGTDIGGGGRNPLAGHVTHPPGLGGSTLGRGAGRPSSWFATPLLR